MPEEIDIYLGFAVEGKPDPVLDFPDGCQGKIGGKPVWLNPNHIPNVERLTCLICRRPMRMLLQIYAPHEELEHAFHRTLYIFCCTDGDCHKNHAAGRYTVLRCQLPEKNPYYIAGEEQSWTPAPSRSEAQTCDVCGALGTKVCGQCKRGRYCSKEHQVEAWREGHKERCPKAEADETFSGGFLEYELVTELEERDKVKVKEDITDEEIAQKVEAANDAEEKEGSREVDEQYFAMKEDKHALQFQKVVKPYPDQCLRYYGWEGGMPLSVSEENAAIAQEVPPCEYCGSPRIPEFQVLPQLLNHLKLDVKEGNSVDWGVLTVFTCQGCCNSIHKEDDRYLSEYLWRDNFST
ncbi:programmed cell death protein 2-like [Planoprotostelium fungivorum]|uniref:Programmed cell death protein 2-like n=1 Tax=Planoprotostelium fungivorum TaxID=1890364 RepID=A0A2P6MW72_9EUKA|nr:programmed cell death protein 2-like [Planoprotostelium fungivorum]